MEFVISGANARVLAKSIHSFARIGYELFIEGTAEGLAFRVVNSSKLAFAFILFKPTFFETYKLQTRSAGSSQNSPDLENRCKISIKTCLGVFKNMKQVESCKLQLNPITYKLLIQLHCRMQMVKTHQISLLEPETLEAVYASDTFTNKLTATHKLMTYIVHNFQASEDELTLEIERDGLIAKNYYPNSPNLGRELMKSTVSLKSDEFAVYQVNEELTVTFCLREVRAFLSFAEAINIDVSINIDKCGMPIVFVLDKQDSFEANLVMATLDPDEEVLVEAFRKSNVNTKSTISEPSPPVKRPTTKRTASVAAEDDVFVKPSAVKPKENKSKKPKKAASKSTDGENYNLFNLYGSSSSSSSGTTVRRSKTSESDIASLPNGQEISTVLSDFVPTASASTTTSQLKTDSGNLVMEISDDDDDDVLIKTATKTTSTTNTFKHYPKSNVSSVFNTESDDIVVEFRDESESPPKKPVRNVDPRTREIFRNLFSRCIQPTFDMRQIPGADVVLAECSDEE